jgi:soluble lytic murein transglycosylase
MKRRLFPAILLAFCISSASPVFGDIYRYQDENGVWHFSNIKSDKRFRLYIREYRKKPKKYIKDFGHFIDEASKRFGVEKSLIKAVIMAESAFDHKAVSRKGAQGLMQLMPSTADEMDVNNPFNPRENIIGGTRYLSKMLKRFKNNKRLAVAAYNAGPEAVTTYRGIPPYSETRTFVNRVLKYYQKFR